MGYDETDVRFRCRSRTNPFEYHHILVTIEGVASCSCSLDYCSHIDAVLAHGHLVTVHPNDILDARLAQQRTQDKITPPKWWKTTWQNDRRWLRLPLRRHTNCPSQTGKPTVCFQGRDTQDLNRKVFQEHAKQHGWNVTETPNARTTTIVVTSRRAQQSDIYKDAPYPVLSYDDWLILEPDLYDACLKRIREWQKITHAQPITERLSI